MKTVLATLLLLAVCAVSVFGQDPDPSGGFNGGGGTPSCQFYVSQIGWSDTRSRDCGTLSTYQYRYSWYVTSGSVYVAPGSGDIYTAWINRPCDNSDAGASFSHPTNITCVITPINARQWEGNVVKVFGGTTTIGNRVASLGCDGCSSPIVFSPRAGEVSANPFGGVDDGVNFDLDSNGIAENLSWLKADSGVSVLGLDRNNNGRLDNGEEVFGNFTPQPDGTNRNGFYALAVFDKPENGGNGDGLIDTRDAVFNKLLAWQDVNHNGVSEATELTSLPSIGVISISLDFKTDEKRDRYGNLYRLRSEITVMGLDGVVKKLPVYDVYLVTN